MIFIDSNPFIYAFYKPRYGVLDEKVLTTTVHISEVYNLLKRNYNQEMLNRLVYSLILKENIQIASVDEAVLLSGQEMAIDNNVDLNHFDGFKWVKRLTK